MVTENMPIVGALALFEAKPGNETDVERFFLEGLPIVRRQPGTDFDPHPHERLGYFGAIPTFADKGRAVVGEGKRDQPMPADHVPDIHDRYTADDPSTSVLHHEHKAGKGVRLGHRARPRGKVESGRVLAVVDEPQPIRIVETADVGHPPINVGRNDPQVDGRKRNRAG